MISASDILSAKVLIVDDQQANVLLLERMLRGAGYVSITSTMDPGAVCELHLKNRYDLILLDLQMPGMDGFQVMEGLRTIEMDGYLPVLVITAQPAHMLEVRLLYKKVENYSKVLEQMVEKRTAELHESEARFHALREMAGFCAQLRQRHTSVKGK